VESQDPDVINADPPAFSARFAWVRPVSSRLARRLRRGISSRLSWMMALLVLLAAALTGAVTAAVHYRGEVAALHRHPPMVYSRIVTLPPFGTLDGRLTVLSVRFTRGRAWILTSAHISGARPRTGYSLTGSDCAATTQTVWATGVTAADGSGDLTGHTSVLLTDKYWLYLSSSSARSSISGVTVGRGLLGSFTPAGKFSASPAADAACLNP
jgi:hypothetical protein